MFIIGKHLSQYYVTSVLDNFNLDIIKQIYIKCSKGFSFQQTVLAQLG